MEEKELKIEETKEENNADALVATNDDVKDAESTAIQKDDVTEDIISYSSKYLENVEEERGKFLKVYRGQNTVKWIVTSICIIAIIFGCIFVPNIVPGTGGTAAMISILVVSLVGMILYSVFSKKSIQKKMHSYFDSYYDNINHFVFDLPEITNLKAQFPGKIESQAFLDNCLYKDIIDVGSRGLTEFEYRSIPIAIVDCAAQVRKEKRIVPVYVGKYLFAASNYSYDEPLYVYFKGDKRALPPTNLDNVKVVQEDEKMIVYSNNKDWKKVINVNVKKILSKIKMNKELVDLSISFQKGRMFVCMGYDDPLMILPLQNKFNPRPTEIFKQDVKNVLNLIEEFNK